MEPQHKMESIPLVNKDLQYVISGRKGFVFLALDGAAYHHIFFTNSLHFNLRFTDRQAKRERKERKNAQTPDTINTGCEFCVLKRQGQVFISEDGSVGRSLYFKEMARVHMTFTDESTFDIKITQQMKQTPPIDKNVSQIRQKNDFQIFPSKKVPPVNKNSSQIKHIPSTSKNICVTQPVNNNPSTTIIIPQVQHVNQIPSLETNILDNQQVKQIPSINKNILLVQPAGQVPSTNKDSPQVPQVNQVPSMKNMVFLLPVNQISSIKKSIPLNEQVIQNPSTNNKILTQSLNQISSMNKGFSHTQQVNQIPSVNKTSVLLPVNQTPSINKDFSHTQQVNQIPSMNKISLLQPVNKTPSINRDISHTQQVNQIPSLTNNIVFIQPVNQTPSINRDISHTQQVNQIPSVNKISPSVNKISLLQPVNQTPSINEGFSHTQQVNQIPSVNEISLLQPVNQSPSINRDISQAQQVNQNPSLTNNKLFLQPVNQTPSININKDISQVQPVNEVSPRSNNMIVMHPVKQFSSIDKDNSQTHHVKQYASTSTKTIQTKPVYPILPMNSNICLLQERNLNPTIGNNVCLIQQASSLAQPPSVLQSLLKEPNTCNPIRDHPSYTSTDKNSQQKLHVIPQRKRSAPTQFGETSVRNLNKKDTADKKSSQNKRVRGTKEHESKKVLKKKSTLLPSSSHKKQYYATRALFRLQELLKEENSPSVQLDGTVIGDTEPKGKIMNYVTLEENEREAARQQTNEIEDQVDETLLMEVEECKPLLEALQQSNASMMEAHDHESLLMEEECKPTVEEIQLLQESPLKTFKESECVSNKSKQSKDLRKTVAYTTLKRHKEKILDKNPEKNSKLKLQKNIMKSNKSQCNKNLKTFNTQKEKKVKVSKQIKSQKSVRQITKGSVKSKSRIGKQMRNKPAGKVLKTQKCVKKPAKKVIKSKLRKQKKKEDSDYNPESEEDEDDDINEWDENAPDELVYRIKYPPRPEKKGIHPCRKCDEVFEYFKDLRKHDRLKHPIDLTCDICDKLCDNVTQWKRHMKTHQGVFACNICGLIFQSSHGLVAHKKKIHNLELSKTLCDKCGGEFKKNGKKVHRCKHSSENFYPCKLCKEDEFKNSKELRQHWREHHSNDLNEHGERIVKPCPQCDEAFLDEKMLALHVKIHEPAKCLHCGKICKNERGLETHLVAHFKSRQHSCRRCHMKFKTLISLARHWSSKHRKPKLKCDDCGRRFADFEVVKKHLLRHITGCKKPERRYCCDYCQMRFFSPASIKRHLLSHTKVQSFACHICQKHFSLAYNLTVHMRQHTKEQPFMCQVCGMAFGHKCSLQGHLRAKHKIES